MFRMSLVCFCLLLSFTNFANVRGDYKQLYDDQSPDDLIYRFMEQHNIPGLQVAIVQAPYIPRVIGYGVTNVKTRQLVSVNTLFPLGMLSAGYTNIAALQLVEQNKLSLDSSLGEHLSSLPKAWQSVSIRQLISQTSGIADYTSSTQFDMNGSYQPSQLLGLVKKEPLVFKPGSQVSPSRTNYVLLGQLIEKISGMSYKAYVKKYQFEPLKLKNTYFIDDIPKRLVEQDKTKQFLKQRDYISPPELATGYPVEAAPSFNPSAYYASGDLAANAEDVSVWDVGLAGGILIKDKALRDFLYHPIQLSNGQMVPANGHWQFPGHIGLMHIQGNAPGFSSYLDRFTNPKELVCVTVLANKANLPEITVLSRKIAASYQTALQAPKAAFWMSVRQSPYSVDETANRLESLVKANDGKVFAKVDNQAEAKKVTQTTDKSIALLIGNPAVGSNLLKQDPKLSLMAPLRVAIWQTADKQVWLGYPNVVKLAQLMNASISGDVAQTVNNRLMNLVNKTVSAY